MNVHKNTLSRIIPKAIFLLVVIFWVMYAFQEFMN